jgi:LmbE family N-acetylglucosaminyl deacetylase
MNIEHSLPAQYTIPDEWKESSRPVIAIGAHPDDEGRSKIITELPSHGVPTIYIYLTQGENGVPAHIAHLEESEVKKTRIAEAEKAVASWGGVPLFFDFGDLHASISLPYSEVFRTLFPTIRALNPVGLISDDKNDTPWGWDHPDHKLAGRLTEDIGAALDVTRFYPNASATIDRPTLLLMTTNIFTNNLLMRHLTTQERQEQLEYFLNHYPSQFRKEGMDGPEGWVENFNRNWFQPSLNDHYELVKQIR